MMTAKFDFARVTQTTVRDLVEIFGPSGVSVDREKVTAYSKDEVALHLWDKEYTADVVFFTDLFLFVILYDGGTGNFVKFCRKYGTDI